jgi:predicted TIM-barrel fold metal-dependent hydrolase
VSLLERYETVYLETSCIMGYAAIEKTVARCGHAQLLFGSGAPLQEAASGLSKVTHAGISTTACEAILGRNLQRLLGESKA